MPQKTLTTRIILRNDIQANWNSVKPVLMKGEIGLETDTGNYKIGDGTTAYDLLPLYSNIKNSDKNSLDRLIEMLNDDGFGKVDDVTVNDTSVLGEDKVAKIVIGDLVVDGNSESFTGDIVLHKIAKSGKYADLEGKPSIVDNLDSQSATDILSANQGRVLKQMVQSIPSAEAYTNIQSLITALNSLERGKKNVGSNLYVQTTNVPDFWVYGVVDTSSTYTYTTDQAFIDAVKQNGYVQVGYYQVSLLETEKVDLSNYYTKAQVDGFLANKITNNSDGVYVGKFSNYTSADGHFGYSVDIYNSDGTKNTTISYAFNKSDFTKSADGVISLSADVLRESDTFILDGGNSEA